MRYPFLLLALFVAMPSNAADYIPISDNLTVEDIPPVPMAIAEVADRYTEFRSAHPTSWHPYRREMLISTRFAETAQTHRVRFPGGAREQLTFFSDRVQAATLDPALGNYFVFEKDTQGNEIYQIYRYDFATGTITLLTDGKSRHAALAWSPAWGMAHRNIWSHAGDKMAYVRLHTSGNTTQAELRVLNPLDPKTDRLIAETPGTGLIVVDWSFDDKKILATEFISVNESYLWSIDVQDGTKTLITPNKDGQKSFYGGGQFSKNGAGIYTVTNRDSEFQRLTFIDLKTNNHTYLTSDIPWDVEEFAVAHNGKTIAFATNEDGISTLHLMDANTKNKKKVTGLPVGVIGSLMWHANSRDLGFSLSSAQSPTDAYSLDVKKGKIERWTTSETGGLNPSNFSEPKLIRFKSFDDRFISAFLYEPPATRFTGPRPVIVQIHGGPEAQFRPSFLGRINFYLEELGAAVIFPNIRGSSGYGKTYLTLDDGKKREDAYKDIGALFDWIAVQKKLDANRIMVTGGSYGGHMTFATATHYPEKIRCALSVVGISNLRSFLENTESYRRDLRRAEYGDERNPEIRQWMENLAPVNNAKKMAKPLFVVQGLNDPRVPASEALQIAETLRKQNTPIWFLMAKDEGHGFSKKKNQDFQFYSTLLFMQKYLLN